MNDEGENMKWPEWLSFKPDPEGENIRNTAVEVCLRYGLTEVERLGKAEAHRQKCGCPQCQGQSNGFIDAEDRTDWIIGLNRWNPFKATREGNRIDIKEIEPPKDDEDSSGFDQVSP